MQKLTEIQLSALKELGNIGIGNTATLVSELLNNTVDVSLPKIKRYPKQLPDPVEKNREIFMTSHVHIEGQFKAHTLLFFTPECSMIFNTNFVRIDQLEKKILTNEDKLSIFKEFAVMLAFAYSNALSRMLGVSYALQDAAAISMVTEVSLFEFVKKYLGENEILGIETDFILSDLQKTLLGTISFFIEDAMVTKLLSSMGV
ncbi:MAG: chemotaxis protein CheC [Candidatus Omnitrophota bacterium]